MNKVSPAAPLSSTKFYSRYELRVTTSQVGSLISHVFVPQYSGNLYKLTHLFLVPLFHFLCGRMKLKQEGNKTFPKMMMFHWGTGTASSHNKATFGPFKKYMN